jgi:type VI protein secretion system component Hcp
MLVFASGSAYASAPVTTNIDEIPLTYDVYLKLNGINGDSNVIGYEKWIVLSGVRFSVSNTSGGAAGSGGGAGKSVLNEFTMTKPFDSSSIALFQTALSGSMIKSGQLAFVPRGSDRLAPILTIDLADIEIVAYEFNNLYETATLKFASIVMKYSSTNEKGGQNPPIIGGWDFSKGSKQ